MQYWFNIRLQDYLRITSERVFRETPAATLTVELVSSTTNVLQVVGAINIQRISLIIWYSEIVDIVDNIRFSTCPRCFCLKKYKNINYILKPNSLVAVHLYYQN